MDENKNKVYSNLGNEDVNELIPNGAKYILDLGCGDGSNARILVNKGCIVDGVTISDLERDVAQQVMRNVYVYNLENGLPKLEENMYDVVICSHVLEHICYPQQLLQDIYHVQKSNGILIVALPNLMHYKSRYQLFRGNFNYQPAGIWDFTHFRCYTFASAIKLLQQHKFVVDKKTVTGTLPFNSFFKLILPNKVSSFLYKILIGISHGLFGYQLLFVAKKTFKN